MEFTLGQIVTNVTGEYEAQLEVSKPKSDTKIKVYVEEKKANYGSKLATFGIEFNYNEANKLVFVVVNKVRAKAKIQPVFKTECKRSKGGKYTFEDIQIDTDTLFDEDDDKECLIQAYKYKENGYHNKLCEIRVSYKDLKDNNIESGRLKIMQPRV